MGSRKIDNGKLDSLDRWYLRGGAGIGGREADYAGDWYGSSFCRLLIVTHKVSDI